ncbi:stage II sporulation protein M [Nitrosopumilus sp. S4]
MLKIRIITFFIFLGLFSLSFQIGAMYDISDEEANAFVQDFLSNTNKIDGIGIFVNNIKASLPMFVPGFGIIWGAYTAWSTGFGFAAIQTMAPALADMIPLSILYQSPFGLMELVAYSIAMSRSFHILMSLVKRTNLKNLTKPTLIEVGIVVIILLVAGFLEEYMINSSSGL